MVRGEEAAQVMRSVGFSYYSVDEVRAMSVKRITSHLVVDHLGKPVRNGLYDPALGPVEQKDTCETCGEMSVLCPGHFGNIDLVMPVYNPLLYRSLLKILKNACLYCHHFKHERNKIEKDCEEFLRIMKDSVAETGLGTQKNVLTSGQFVQAKRLVDEFLKNPGVLCHNCRATVPTIKSEGHGKMFQHPLSATKRKANVIKGRIGIEDLKSKSTKDEASEDGLQIQSKKKKIARNDGIQALDFKEPRILLPSEVKEHMRLIWKNEKRVCSLFWGDKKFGKASLQNNKGSSVFFLEVLAVTPNRFRPPNYMNNMLMEHPQNVLYGKVLQANMDLSNYIAENSENTEKGLLLWMNLQNGVNELIDSTTAAGKDRSVGIRQLLEKKTGLFRWHMMGKRVNHTCRSVISPDPFIAVNDIGIPPNFAMKLTYPERVTPWNVQRLRKNVENGPDVHPGATHVEDEQGVRISLQHVKPYQRIAIAKTLLSTPSATGSGNIESGKAVGKIVYRHMQDGDILLVNRQPTLHKPGVMGHTARVITGQRALRLHYANCSTYNADFDGDEMNVHFPQDELGRAEAYQIVNANQQYVVPTSGDPIRGLIQDHIVSASLLTKKGTYFTKDEYHQLVYAACVPMPTSRSSKTKAALEVFEHDPVLTTVSPAICKPQCLWTGKQVVTTILNYVTRGRPPFSFERAGKVSGDYLGKNSEELKVVVQDNELLCGIIDKAQFGKFGMVHSVQELYGADDAGHLLSVFSRLFSSYLHMHGFTCGIADMLLLPQAEEERTDKLRTAENELGDIVHGRFVGVDDKHQSEVGIEKIKDETGKILQMRGDAARARLDMLMSSAMNGVTSNVNNALFPKGLMKPFPDNCLSLMTVTGAKGGMVNFTQISSLLGQQELEGKRVPRMISGKTLPCFQPYEPVARSGGFVSDRFLTGLRPQEYYFHCMAGRDGLVDTAVKTAKSGYLQRCIIKNLECLKISYDFTVRDSDGSIIQFCYGEDGVDVSKSSCLTNFELLSANRSLVTRKLGIGKSTSSLTDDFVSSDAYIQDMPEGLKEKFDKFLQGTSKIEKRLLKLKREKHIAEFKMLLKHKYFSSLAAPGEPVGVLAGQSIGEPSTQMTLNTFHFAGRGEMNVTLGIPRLHEILTVASRSIKTPIMTCPLKPGRTREEGERLAGRLTKISLADILEAVEISAVPFHLHNGIATKVYKVKLRVYPAERYPVHLNLTREEVDMTTKVMFPKLVQREIEREIKSLTEVSAKDSIKMLGVEESIGGSTEGGEGGGGKKGKRNVEMGEAVEDDQDEDDDAEEGRDAEKRKGRTTDEAAYETDSDNEDGEDKGMDFDAEDETEQKGGDGEVVDDEAGEEEDGKQQSKQQRVRSHGTTYEMKFSAAQDSPQIFLPNIIEKVLKGLTIRRVSGIEKCAVINYNGDANSPALQTDGVNFGGLWALGDELDLNRLTSNDVGAMLDTYGVEAARATIVAEVQGVFGSYGIAVNVRHLGLIADFMTFQGGYRPLNRMGIVGNPSPLLKMSFETAAAFLIDATLRRQEDQLDTPSSRIVVGRAVDLGTGCFDLLQKIETTQG